MIIITRLIRILARGVIITVITRGGRHHGLGLRHHALGRRVVASCQRRCPEGLCGGGGGGGVVVGGRLLHRGWAAWRLLMFWLGVMSLRRRRRRRGAAGRGRGRGGGRGAGGARGQCDACGSARHGDHGDDRRELSAAEWYLVRAGAGVVVRGRLLCCCCCCYRRGRGRLVLFGRSIDVAAVARRGCNIGLRFGCLGRCFPMQQRVWVLVWVPLPLVRGSSCIIIRAWIRISTRLPSTCAVRTTCTVVVIILIAGVIIIDMCATLLLPLLVLVLVLLVRH